MELLRALATLCGIILAAVGGFVAYRAAFLDPGADVVITSAGEVREAPELARLGGGLALLAAGAGLAFLAAVRGRR